jgi:chemotaxis protein methyltransferase CheR
MPQDSDGPETPKPGAPAIPQQRPPIGRPAPPLPAQRPPIGREAPPPGMPAVLPLAHGELNEDDAAELLVLKALIQKSVHFECAGYKEKCLRRRIAVRMRARGVHTYGDYAKLLQSDSSEYTRLVDTLTINVSKFFRNPEVWEIVRDRIVPDLYAMTAPIIQVWSAGAASGEEAYTMSMIVQDYAAANGVSPDRFRILGTDIDRDSLAIAERAEYTTFAMGDIDAATLERWFHHDGVYRLRPEARRHVRFETLDLIREEFPQGQHLIFCRNVIIYFERAVQEELFRKFYDSLVPGGYLVLGKVEALFGAASARFQTIGNRQRVFRKP